MNATTQVDNSTGTAPHTVDSCDLCGSFEHRLVATETEARCNTVICTNCGLMFASPRLTPKELEVFYHELFAGDAGSDALTVDAGLNQTKVASEEKRAFNWALPVVRKVMDLRDKRILDLRSRTGALAALLVAQGARVEAVDPFDTNVDYASKIRRLASVHQIGFSKIDELPPFDDQQFDAVTALTVHLLSHSLSPQRILGRIHTLLKPGGYLMLDEKDVLRPGRFAAPTIFDTGKAHQFHLTAATLEAYVAASGFEVLSCSEDGRRISEFHHILVVARKPSSDAESQSVYRPFMRKQAPDDVVRCVRRIERYRSFYRIRGQTLRRTKKLGKKLKRLVD